MTTEMEKALGAFSVLILQVKNKLYPRINIVERTIRAQQKLTGLIFEQILLHPGEGLKKDAEVLERKIIDRLDVCLFYLIDKNGGLPLIRTREPSPDEPLDVYLMNYIHDKLFEIIDFLDVYRDIVVPQWYEMIS